MKLSIVHIEKSVITTSQPNQSVRLNVSWIENNLTSVDQRISLEDEETKGGEPTEPLLVFFVASLQHSKLNHLGSSLAMMAIPAY